MNRRVNEKVLGVEASERRLLLRLALCIGRTLLPPATTTWAYNFDAPVLLLHLAMVGRDQQGADDNELT